MNTNTRRFEIGNVYADSNGKEYRIISRTNKTVTIEDANRPGLWLYQRRKALQTYADGSEFLEMVKGKAATYRNHKKYIGRYQTSSGRKAVTIQA